jgi:hypothetical protein
MAGVVPRPSTSWLFPHKEDVDPRRKIYTPTPDMTILLGRRITSLARCSHGVISATMTSVDGSTR